MPERNQARAQVMRCADESLSRAAAGETLIAIHDDLVARGQLTCAYRTFTRWIKRRSRESQLPKHSEQTGDSPR